MNALIVFFILFAGSYVNGIVLIRHLRSAHHATWVALGEPTLTQSNLGAPRLRLMKFVWRFEFLRLHDVSLKWMCIVAMLLEIGLAATFVLLIVFP